MSPMPSGDSIAYSTAAAHDAELTLLGIISELANVIADRRRDVDTAMASFQADGVSDQYAEVEARWTRDADRVEAFIVSLRETLGRNNITAEETLARSQNIVGSCG